jgi:hypothetical protein
MFGTVDISTMKISTSSQTEFDDVSGIAELNVGDAVSFRCPLLMVSGTPTLVDSEAVD